MKKFFFEGIQNEDRRVTVNIVVKLIIAVMLVVFSITMLRIYMLDIMVVKGDSMVPSLSNGSLVLVRKFDVVDIDHGDIVVAVVVHGDRGDKVIKRVIGIPGDVVEVTYSEVNVNGRTIAHMNNFDGEPNFWILGEGQYFLLGDNIDDSVDSRMFGPCERVQIQGIVCGH